MLLIYLITLGLCTWFGPKVAAVIEERDARAEASNVHAIAAFLLGIIPALNVLFLFFGAILLVDIAKVLKADDKAGIYEFNKKLRELFDE
jgi:hypothetical protein